MSLTIRKDEPAATDLNKAVELKLPPPGDFTLGNNLYLKNCTNSTFGTKVDLTVNQYVNIGGDKSTGEHFDLKKGLKGLIVTDSALRSDWKEKLLRYKYIWIALFVALCVIAVSCLFLPTRHSKEIKQDVELPNNYTLRLRTRPEWFSLKPEIDCMNISARPAMYVLVAHTVTTNCKKQINCENVIKEIQNYHLTLKFCDIAYNFIVAGDGFIYEGIGWGKSGRHTKGFNCDSIGVAFLGNYELQRPTTEMEEAFYLLIEEGLKLNEISSDYKLLGQYQVRESKSPGLYLIERMKHWKNWSIVKPENRSCGY